MWRSRSAMGARPWASGQCRRAASPIKYENENRIIAFKLGGGAVPTPQGPAKTSRFPKLPSEQRQPGADRARRDQVRRAINRYTPSRGLFLTNRTVRNHHIIAAEQAVAGGVGLTRDEQKPGGDRRGKGRKTGLTDSSEKPLSDCGKYSKKISTAFPKGSLKIGGAASGGA